MFVDVSNWMNVDNRGEEWTELRRYKEQGGKSMKDYWLSSFSYLARDIQKAKILSHRWAPSMSPTQKNEVSYYKETTRYDHKGTVENWPLTE